MGDMKHAIVSAIYILALVIGNSPAAHAMGHAHGSDPVSMAAGMDDDHAASHGSEEQTMAHCCAVSVGHCSSATVRHDVAVHELHYSVEAQARPLDDIAKAKPGPGIDPPPPRV